MGCYGGDIEGKFWVGIQSSDDARHFGVDPEGPIRMYSECFRETEDLAGTPCDCSPNCVATDQNEIGFCFKDPEPVRAKLAELDEELLEITPKWKEVQELLEDDEWKKSYTAEWVSPEVDRRICEICQDNGFLELAARYVLGVQILRCLLTHGKCDFWCEL